MLKVTVAICTWNRSRLLEQTLNGICDLRVPEQVDWELLIVDNGSTDDTADTIGQFTERLPIRSVIETTPGHCAARNRAVDEFEGDLLLWTDDDVIVSNEWLSQYAEHYQKNGQSEAFWGGPILAQFEQTVPTWIEENWEVLKGCFALRELGDESIQFSPSKLPYGANFAIRGDIQKQFRFDPELGRKRDRVVGGDEIDLMTRLMKSGYSGSWIPQAKVNHIIPPDRTSEKYVYDYFVGQGKLLDQPRRRFDRIMLQLKKEWHRLRLHLARNKQPSGRWLAHLINSALAAGRLER